jgi:ubiquinone/menaquinone biosynthesis C-methylase UbiE
MLYNTPAFKLHEELQLHADNRVLDIGSGRGALLQLLASRVRFERPPVGVDVSRAMLDLAEPGSTQRLQASGTSLPLADESFDVVTCGYVTQHLDDDGLLALLREVRRVLTPGGIALVWDFAPTRSLALNNFHARVLALGADEATTRNYTTLSAYALEAGFEWVSNAHLRPFLFPPIPRVSIIVGKAPIGWEPPAMAEGLTPDTHAGTLVAGVTG